MSFVIFSKSIPSYLYIKFKGMSKYVSAQEAVKIVKSGDRVYLQAAAAAPTILANALTERASELRDVEICHLHTEGEARYANPDLAASFHVNSFLSEKMFVTL